MSRTRAEQAIWDHVMGINLGRCTWCHQPATQVCHRLPTGQGGPYTTANMLPGCGLGNAGGCHGLTERRRALSYACGWLLHQDVDPAGRDIRIAASPALIRTAFGVGWHMLDGPPRLADPGEVPDWMWPGTYEDAISALHGLVTA